MSCLWNANEITEKQEAKLGKYGLYIQCCSFYQHRYKLDQI